jgi:hypothetical protein
VRGVQPRALALTASAGLCLWGCGIGDFDVERGISEQRVPGNALSGLLETFFDTPIPMNVNIQEETAARDSGPAQSAHLTRLDFRITASAMSAPDKDDFSFLRSASVFIESTRAGSELPRQKIAEAEDIQASAVLSFHTFDRVDILPYTEEGARFVSEAEASAPPDDVTFEGSFTVSVELF